MAAPKQTDPQFKLRMTPWVKDQIESAAKANNRSMNAEMLARLETYDLLHHRTAELAQERDDFKKALEAANAWVADANERRDQIAKLQGEVQQLRLELEREKGRNASDAALLEANARAEKYESLMRSARNRLQLVRRDRDSLAHYVKAVSEGIEDDFIGQTRIDSLDDRSLLLKIYFETLRLNSELVLQRRARGDYDGDIIANDEGPSS